MSISVGETPAAVSRAPRGARGGRARRRKWTFDRISLFVVFLGVPLVIFLVFVIWPFIQAVIYSFTNWSGFTPDYDFIGFGNFVKLANDATFLKALLNNILLAVVVPFATIVIALTFASWITVAGPSSGPMRGIRASSFYRVISFFPYVIPAIVSGLIWAQVFSPSSGLLNGLLNGLGLPFESFAWLGDESTARWVLMFVIVWSFVGFYMVLFIAAIKGVPAETYEAARLDGAGRFRMAVSITVPQIRDSVQTAYIYLGIAALDSFVYVQALTPGGGPNNSTLVMSQYLFRQAFTKGQFGYASALGVTLAIVTLLFAAIVFAVNRISAGRDEGARV